MVSKFCIFVIWNSLPVPILIPCSVVNWFQNFVSLWSETVKWVFKYICCKLWIGFKILYLCDLKQSIPTSSKSKHCCELVSKFCIFVVWNSLNSLIIQKNRLWIGFKILYLCGLKQYDLGTQPVCLCCELVSKFCIFVVWNSRLR